MSNLVVRGIMTFIIISFAFSWPIFFVVDAWWLPKLAAAGETRQAHVVALFGHMLAMLGPSVGALVAFRLVHKTPLPPLRMGRLHHYLWAALAMLFVMGVPAVLGLSFGKSIHGFQELDQLTLILLGVTLTLGWVAAMGEEAGWCMYLLTVLHKKWGKTRAIIFSGIVRGLWHWPVLVGVFIYQAIHGEMAIGELALRSFGIAIQLMISNIFFGALFGWLWYKTESLPLVGWMHICYDFVRDASFVLLVGYQTSAFFPLWAVPFNIAAIILLMGIAKREGVTIKTLFSRPATP